VLLLCFEFIFSFFNTALEFSRHLPPQLMKKRDQVMASERQVLQAWAEEDNSITKTQLEVFEQRALSLSHQAAMAGAAADARLLERSYGASRDTPLTAAADETAMAGAPSLSVAEQHGRRLEELSKARVRRQQRVDELAALLDADQSSSQLPSTTSMNESSAVGPSGTDGADSGASSAESDDSDDGAEGFFSQARGALSSYQKPGP
jgi:hypothetical protein